MVNTTWTKDPKKASRVAPYPPPSPLSRVKYHVSDSDCIYAISLAETIAGVSARTEELSERDLKAWAEAREAELKKAYEDHVTAAMFKNIRAHIPKVARDIARMAWPSGKIAEDYHENREVFPEYFRTRFDAETLPFETLSEKDWETAARFASFEGLPPLDINLIPTSVGLAARFSHRKPFKGVGEDLIGEVLRQFPVVMASLFTPLAIKSVVLASTPFQLKSGCLHELSKNAGLTNQPVSYRDIMLASEIGKTIASDIRPHIVEQAKRVAIPTQYRPGLNQAVLMLVTYILRIALKWLRPTSGQLWGFLLTPRLPLRA